MTKSIFNISAFFMLIIFIGCGKKVVISHEINSSLPIKKARENTEKCVFSQHRQWKVSDFIITDKCLIFSDGTITRNSSSGIATSLNGVAIGSSGGTSRTKNLETRIYYSAIKDVKLDLWSRKFKQWYTVKLITDESFYYVYRTRSLEKAEECADGVASVVAYYKNYTPPKVTEDEYKATKPSLKIEDRLSKIKFLYENGHITNEEYLEKRKKILEGI
ncbi:SHOCT domain-containing protein [Sulfurimonas sp.]|uniref:SHOCT domain-containing protein n=1 Tax=Sulfurimonas sp. TaxID=2022749 RepID=UPI002AB1829D|nr:SHOCT domain-containing protein [Sulfurimonas sp.]